ncbi:MAG: hypothetical protein RSB67_04370 [Clostridia bacterium]
MYRKNKVNYLKLHSIYGISLIMLVITIIVMIILATTVIITIVQNNPIEKTKEAKFKSDIKNVQEELEMYVDKQYLDTLGNFDRTTVRKENLELLKDSRLSDKIDIQNGQLVYIGKDEKEKIWFDDIIGNIPEIKYSLIEEFAKTNVEYVDASSENKTAIIPKGFKILKDETNNAYTNIDEGLVIVDKNGNEFVWIPVGSNINGTVLEYKKREYNQGTRVIDTDKEADVVKFSGLKDQLANMDASVLKNKGFYLSRYEAGKDINGNLVSKRGMQVWNYITWNDAKLKVEGMIYDSVKATLPNGKMWDTVITLAELSGKDPLDSTLWGNQGSNPYKTNVTPNNPAHTGAHEKWMVKNIYDFAGNVWEWTNEIEAFGPIGRGGCYSGEGSDDTVACRGCAGDIMASEDYMGFRIALYII